MSLVQQQQQHHHQNNLDTKSYRFCSLDRMNWKRSNLWHLLRRPNTFENDRIKAREVQNFLSALFLEKDKDNDDKIVVSLPRGMSVLSRRNKNIRRWCETWMSAIYCVRGVRARSARISIRSLCVCVFQLCYSNCKNITHIAHSYRKKTTHSKIRARIQTRL